MADYVQQFINQVKEASDSGDINSIETFITDVQEVFEKVIGEGFTRLDVLTDVDSDSLTFRLQDEEEIAEYELFSIHLDGTIDFYFIIETEDYHHDTFGFEALENNPTLWFEGTFDDMHGIDVDELLEHEDEFVEELTSAIENFSIDINTILETDDEVDKMDRDMNMEEPDFDRGRNLDQQGGTRETF